MAFPPPPLVIIYYFGIRFKIDSFPLIVAGADAFQPRFPPQHSGRWGEVFIIYRLQDFFFLLRFFFEFPLLDINLSSSRSRNYICNKPAPSGRRGRNETGIVIAKVEHLPAISTKVKSLDRLKIMLAKSEPETNKPIQGIKSINITHAVAPGFYSEMSSLVGIQVGWGTKKRDWIQFECLWHNQKSHPSSP